MRAVRRLYFYAVAFISLQVVLWGAVSLGRNLASAAGRPFAAPELLASGLSAVLVGLPVFLLHWAAVQREAKADPQERGHRVRALFFYLTIIFCLVPFSINGLALVNGLLLRWFNVSSQLALAGASQAWTDNAVALLVLGLGAAFFTRRLRREWAAPAADTTELHHARRLERAFWWGWGIGLVVLGVHQLLRYVLWQPVGLGGSPSAWLANGLAALLIGLPLWLYAILRLEGLNNPGLVRVGAYALVRLGALALGLTAALPVLEELFLRLLGAPRGPEPLALSFEGRLATLVPLLGVWLYAAHQLRREGYAGSDGLRRLLATAEATIGLLVVVLGLRQLTSFLLGGAGGGLLSSVLAQALAALLVGLPLWLANWLGLQREAAPTAPGGDLVRVALLRKVHLYGVLFVGVLLTMISAGRGLYNLLQALLARQPLSAAVIWPTVDLLVFSALLALLTLYHRYALNQDQRSAGRAQNTRLAQFPTLIIDPADGSFGRAVITALAATAPQIPVAVQPIALGAPGPEMTGARLVVLPAGLALQPPEALRLWLQGHVGQRLIVPLPGDPFVWLGQAPPGEGDLPGQVAQAIRQLAEGQPVRSAPQASPWAVVGYIAAGLLALQAIAVLLTLVWGD